MSLKEDVTKDLLCVAAHGTPQARSPAANLLFYYWPSLNPTAYDRRNILGKFNTSPTWKPPPCRYLLKAQTSAYSQVPIKRVGPNKRVRWTFLANLMKK